MSSKWIIIGVQCFSFFAITTSLLGVSMSLADFLADFFKLLWNFEGKQTIKGRLALCLLTLLPPFILTLFNPSVFYVAIDYAGAFGVVILLGVMPALMVWAGRKKVGVMPFRVVGGRGLLVVVLLCSLLVSVTRIGVMQGWLAWSQDNQSTTLISEKGIEVNYGK